MKRRWVAWMTGAVVVAAGLSGGVASRAVAGPCDPGNNPIVCENSKPGTPNTVWDNFSGSGDSTLQGFATDISVNAGSPVSFKIKSTASAYSIDIYRLGWYQGNGARLITSVTPSASLPQTQPACVTDPSTNLYDCGNWAVSATWNVPGDAVSGVYLAVLTRPDTGGASHIPFIVRNDAGHSSMIFQTSDTSWQAYNSYGGSDFYQGVNQLTSSQSRGFKISYNRPIITRGNSAHDYLMSNEYPMIRFLERNGYDVAYQSGLDTDRFGSLLLNHHTYLSVGHDEYWSGPQRANVQAARDAGVNLAFFSGNEMYWRTRWEPSIDGTATANRTLVCYKETWDSAKIDPSPQWTGTFRDPRFATPTNGGGAPENGLIGTAYMSNFTDLPIQVSAAEGKLRIWRNTSAATLSPGQVKTLAPDTIGYESDEDLDNGFRPAGLIRMSTTTGSTPQYLQDFGNTVQAGTTTHHITMYKAPSGARVFGAGTIQWSFGLDDQHDVSGGAVDPTMQQATINVLADLGSQPGSLMAGMSPAAQTSDTTPPTVSITSPAPGSLANGTSLTVSGSATDQGGVVAGVEVSLDGGETYHPATGTSSWSYTGILHGSSSGAIKVRAADDSANLSAPATAGVTAACPCSLFGAQVPQIPDSADGSPVELGVKFTSDLAGFVTGIRFYKSTANTGTHAGTLWSATGAKLATGAFTGETASGWQTLTLPAPVSISANTTYVVSYSAPVGHYSVASGSSPDAFWYAGKPAAPLRALSAQVGGDGVYGGLGTFPTQTYNAANYFVDVLFNDKDIYPPVVVGQTPVPGSSSVPPSVAPSATFNKDLDPSTITMTLTASGGTPVAGTATYAAATRTVTFTPSQNLAAGTTFTVSVAAADTVGNVMTAPTTWTFTSQLAPAVPEACPCSLWDDTAVPATLSSTDPDAVELGVTFRTDYDGIITGVRFYKGLANTGTHTGSLWSAAGQLLNTVTFTNESTTGWQVAHFATPTSVTAHTDYVISYHTAVGHYSVDSGGLANGLVRPPLSVAPGGSLYKYGATAFPAGGSSHNYWVDPIFTLPASVVPAVTSKEPGSGATNVPVAGPVTVVFNAPLAPGTGSLTLTPTGGSASSVPATRVSSTTLSFQPAQPLTAGTTYTAVLSGATTTAGTPMASNVTWTFTTAGVGACPCTLFSSTVTPAQVDSGDTGAVTVGVRFRASTNGYVSGVSFYKSVANSGPHTIDLWTDTGSRLATATTSGESASGWQTASFSQPVQLVAGTTYVASYFAPNGRYSANGAFFQADWTNGPLTAPVAGGNGVYAYGSDTFPSATASGPNYWVTPVFYAGSAPDITPPSVVGRTPGDATTHVDAGTTVTATFSEDVQNVALTLSGPAGSVAGTSAFNAATRTATFTPGAALTAGTTYTASASATDLAGNAMAAPYTWSFTTGATQTCPCSVLSASDTPASPTVSDGGTNIELGLAFSSSRNASVTGVRFYKSAANTGTHTGSLWTTGGQLLATVTFTNETASGWQTANFASPVAIVAGQVYVISYQSPTQTWSQTTNQFASQVYSSPPLSVAISGGRYTYGTGFPNTSSPNNYWVDVIVDGTTGPAPSTAPPVISGVSAGVSGSTATITWTTDVASSSTVAFGTTSALGSTATGASGTSHSVTLTGLTSGTTYYYRVTSADAAGNSATDPVVTSAPRTFTAADTVPPTITAVSATGSGTTATITWTTDESSTGSVAYGTTTALGSTATDVVGTNHSVTLTGLTVNTRYYYRVTSADAAGNSSTSPATSSAPASYVPTVQPITHTTVADFSTGSGAYVSDTTGGEVIAQPTQGVEFSGTALPSNWTSTALVTGGTTTVGGGLATVSGARLRTNTLWTNGRSFASVATFGPGQSLGWGSVAAGSTAVTASFATDGTGALSARVNDGGANNTTIAIPGSWTGSPHEFRVDWTTSSSAVFFIDGTQVATSAFAPSVSLRVMASDPTTVAPTLALDWVRVAPYGTSSTFTSAVVDAGAVVGWDALTRDVVVPAGASVTIQVQSGATPTPGTGWTGWTTVSATTNSITRNARYLQYRLQLTTTAGSFVTPAVRSVQISFHVL